MVLNRDAKHKRTSREIDVKYIAQGRAMHVEYDGSWDDEVEEMNRGKVGRPLKTLPFHDVPCCNVQGRDRYGVPPVLGISQGKLG